ncbi:MAG: hypothetical protein A2W90_12170 [Bacteroidetes bacterium GWF2_42_66]|nr:MAG: hypothetical protein A2W92_23255 [Bacteroidetes bacterium GWA2_42_15]OFX99946.1 MAG: hypothetical protein A2W89_17155 [Bacteroidetes bacterium GWE2_42_39]OFY40131.1 MAG: hypothetical protein A2W90_12170 [Bacteroidetes bacterium GWF2_42_66]HBL73955.1 hypothetical protein [Prolixibacteraceae bacterium]HCR89235.1 hypothetical protein [Prolixibacteraceae bacterium]
MKRIITIIINCLIILPNLIQAQNKQSVIPEAYYAQWSGIRPSLDANIEKYRKGDASIQLVDANGTPVSNVLVSIEQKTHAFQFGCNILMLGQFKDKEMNEAYEQEFAKLFNLATTTFTMRDYQPQPGKFRFTEGSEEIWRRPPPDRVVTFGKKYGINLQGQPLLCKGWHPEWAPKDREKVKQLYIEWFKKVAERYGRDFKYWNIVNEMFVTAEKGPDFPLYDPELKYVEWAFKEATKYFPLDNTLTINQGVKFNTMDEAQEYYSFVKKLVDEDVGVESIGIQFHLYSLDELLEGDKTYTPSKFLAIYDKFSKLGIPVFISEITIPSTLDEGIKGEIIQSEILTNLYRLWFSVPVMSGIIYWNLPDGAAHGNEGRVKAGLLDENLKEKPAYQALYQLIHREWTTRFKTEANEQGKVSFRGFYGKYEIRVTAGDKTQKFEIDLSKEGNNENKLVLSK